MESKHTTHTLTTCSAYLVGLTVECKHCHHGVIYKTDGSQIDPEIIDQDFCEYCEGTGTTLRFPELSELCKTCDGKGKIPTSWNSFGGMSGESPCEDCINGRIPALTLEKVAQELIIQVSGFFASVMGDSWAIMHKDNGGNPVTGETLLEAATIALCKAVGGSHNDTTD